MKGLTIKSNFVTFKDRQGEYYTVDDLTRLCKTVITSDIVNFRGNISYGFTDAIADEVLKKLTVKKDGKILIINDLSLHMINKLLEAGYKAENIYLAYGKWNKNATPADDETVYNLMKAFIKANVKEELNIKKLKEIFTMGIKIDGIIANPPYGAIGANITKKIIDTVDFKEYINLLPANDYKRNKEKNLFNYQSDMEAINDGFADAAVTTHIAKIHKPINGKSINNMTLDEFERSNYIDRQLDKYFAKNSKRSHYAIDAMPSCGFIKKNIKTAWEVSKTFIIGLRDMNHKHLPYSVKADTYKWNMLNEGSFDDLKPTTSGQLLISNCNFSTELEKQNFVKFVYDNFKFMSKVFTALNCDGTVHSIAFPKVDWTRAWTVEEILADYGYTPDEIKEVMEDLKNFKGMDD